MLQRTLEPEVMDTAEEANDYDAMDHSEVNARFVSDLLTFAPFLAHLAHLAHLAQEAPPETRVLDVGTGTARIPIELCARSPVSVDALDLASHMLAVAKRNVARAGLEGRVHLRLADAKGTGMPEGSYAAVISNSIVHHIPEPVTTLAEMWRLTAKGGVLFVRDLFRPATEAELDALVARYATPVAPQGTAEAEAEARQRALFRASLLAALTVDEVRAIVASFGLEASAVQATSDRHWTLRAARP